MLTPSRTCTFPAVSPELASHRVGGLSLKYFPLLRGSALLFEYIITVVYAHEGLFPSCILFTTPASGILGQPPFSLTLLGQDGVIAIEKECSSLER